MVKKSMVFIMILLAGAFFPAAGRHFTIFALQPDAALKSLSPRLQLYSQTLHALYALWPKSAARELIRLFKHDKEQTLNQYSATEILNAISAEFRFHDAGKSITGRSGVPAEEDMCWQIYRLVREIRKKADREKDLLTPDNKETLGRLIEFFKKRYVTIKGSDGCYHVLDETFDFLKDLKTGDVVDVFALGGGGDGIAAIFQIEMMKSILRNNGVEGVLFVVYVSNAKYAAQNPDSGPLRAESIEGITPLSAGGHKFSHFYEIKPAITANIKIAENPKQLYYTRAFGEGKVVSRLAGEGIQLLMVDIDQPIDELREEYNKLRKIREGDKEHAVIPLCVDVGGDCLARIVGQLNYHDHPEANVSSPVSDIVGLMIADDARVIITGLGGDAEMGKTLQNYVRELRDKKLITGIFDTPAYCRSHPEIISAMQQYVRDIPSEVSRYLIERHQPYVQDEALESWTELLGPRNIDALLEKDGRLKERRLRYERRKEYITKLYLPSLMIKNAKELRALIAPEILDCSFSWSDIDFILQKKGYITESAKFLSYRSSAKHYSRAFTQALLRQEWNLNDIRNYYFHSYMDETKRLAAARAPSLYRLELSKREKEGKEVSPEIFKEIDKLNRKIESDLLGRLKDKMLKQDIFFIAEAVKTLGIIGSVEALPVLFNLLKNHDSYGTWARFHQSGVPFYPTYFYSYVFIRLSGVSGQAVARIVGQQMENLNNRQMEKILSLMNGVEQHIKTGKNAPENIAKPVNKWQIFYREMIENEQYRDWEKTKARLGLAIRQKVETAEITRSEITSEELGEENNGAGGEPLFEKPLVGFETKSEGHDIEQAV